MKVFKTMDVEITSEKLMQYFGDNFSYLTEMQGLPYLKLELIREYALSEIADMVKITVDGKVVDRSAYDKPIELPKDETGSETDATEGTTPETTTPNETVENTEPTETDATAST
jgi:hypothetical protein